MSTAEWVILIVGVVAIGWVNWYFFGGSGGSGGGADEHHG